jgi:predicted ArsR family transcriptional regulator
LSQAYVPLLTQLVQVFSSALPAEQVDALMRETGKGLAHQLPFTNQRGASLQSRVTSASELLNKELGAVTHVERNGGYVIRGAGCPLAALTGKHPAVCLALESLLSEVLGVQVTECCNRESRPKCCFEIKEGDRPAGRPSER